MLRLIMPGLVGSCTAVVGWLGPCGPAAMAEIACAGNCSGTDMIAQLGLIRSPAKVCGADVDARKCNVRLVAAHGMSVGKQTSTVQRHGKSRTTTYYTSRSVTEASRPTGANRQGDFQEQKADVGCTASAPSRKTESPSSSLTAAAPHEPCISGSIENLSAGVSEHLPTSPTPPRKQIMPFVQNTQGTHVNLFDEGGAGNFAAAASHGVVSAYTGRPQNGDKQNSNLEGKTQEAVNRRGAFNHRHHVQYRHPVLLQR